jgi:hypothetical protein
LRIRLVLGALLACLVVVGGATAADRAGARVFAGETGQRMKVRLDVGSETIQMLWFRARLTCRDGSFLTVDESGFVPTPVRFGHFRDVQVGRTDEVFFRGRVSRRFVRGRLRVRDRLASGVRCGSPWIGFIARRGGR